jgi:hypothetical protein
MCKRYYPIILAVSLFACTLTDPTLVIDSRDVIYLTPVDANLQAMPGVQTLIADSLSHCLLRINLGPKADGSVPVALSTTAGVLTTVAQQPSASSSASLTITPLDREIFVQLNALDITSDNVIVAASVGNVSSATTLIFSPSYTRNLQVMPLTATIPKDSIMDIVFFAVAASGKVSEDQYAKIEASTEDEILLDYPQSVRIVNQKAVFKVVNTTEATGKVEVTIIVPSSKTETKSASLTIIYQ